MSRGNKVMEDVLFQPKLVFIVGNFNDREGLRTGICYPPFGERDEQDFEAQRHRWIDATFAADQHPNDGFVYRLECMPGAFDFFRDRDRVLLVTREFQQEVRRRIPIRDEFEIAISKHRGIIPYNHFLVEERERIYGLQTKVLSMVVEEEPFEDPDFDLRSCPVIEFDEGADVFLYGKREPSKYQSIIRSWFSNSVSPTKYKNSLFNRKRYIENKGGILTPTHNYGSSLWFG